MYPSTTRDHSCSSCFTRPRAEPPTTRRGPPVAATTPQSRSGYRCGLDGPQWVQPGHRCGRRSRLSCRRSPPPLAADSLRLCLLLQGGPGCASLFGAFCELGPDLVDGELGLQPNPGGCWPCRRRVARRGGIVLRPGPPHKPAAQPPSPQGSGTASRRCSSSTNPSGRGSACQVSEAAASSKPSVRRSVPVLAVCSSVDPYSPLTPPPALPTPRQGAVDPQG